MNAEEAAAPPVPEVPDLRGRRRAGGDQTGRQHLHSAVPNMRRLRAGGLNMADIGEPVREVEIPATEPAWDVPEPVEVPAADPELVPA